MSIKDKIGSVLLWAQGYRWRRITVSFISYENADALLRKQGKLARYQSPQWRLAKEEDSNHAYGFVYLELVEFVNDGKVIA